MKQRFITLTNNYSLNKTKLVLNVNGIQGMYPHENKKSIMVKHTSHNNGGYEVAESIDEILKLIKESKAI
jgi:hypothetical protein